MIIHKLKTPVLFFVFLTCLIIPANSASGVDKQPQKSWEKICEQVANLLLPSEDRPSPKDAKTLRECSSYHLYYGFDQPANPEKARLCAYDEIDKARAEGPFNGEAMLMTIYANGVGARRNFDLALKLACKIGGAPAEVEGRVLHLEKLKDKNWQGNNFSLCDDITSGYMAGFCADHANRFASGRRAKRLDKIQSKWTGADKKEYDILRIIAIRYFDIHAENEVDRSGTAGTASSIEDTSSQEEAFTKTLEILEHKKLPEYSHRQFRDADSKLNATYQKIQRNSNPPWGTVTRENIKTTQRAWVKYRDAWVTFCGKKYHDCSSDGIKTYLTLKRIEELEGFLD
ncbi:MAG: hypothetical protein A4E65_01409 [Syntrophorhabdus sp. PtaU1.Bin153]|nr:MAG: hypothetical protein A4E65_01409 [Syntrophorhabdus sp. PtaU1.Bin153]